MARVFKKCETRYAAVRVSFGSLLVQRDQWDTYWGVKKIFFLIRDIDGPAMTAASMESCRFVARRSPWDRLGSVQYTCNRLYRTRRRFQHISANSLISGAHKTMNSLAMASRALGDPEHRRMRYRRLPDPRPIPERAREPICIQKK
jgi:hypothetical protein